MKHSYLAAKLLFLLLFGAWGLPAWAQAQTGSVSGRVTDSKNEGIPGATVLLEGSTLGSSSNVDGTFSIPNVPAGAQTLVISFVGYNPARRPVTVVAGRNTEVSAALSENVTQLNEAVVVGYGTQTRRDLTGSVATVEAKAFDNPALPSFDAGLQGRAAGVQVQQSSGVPGAAVRVRVRGQASISGSSDPLYVVDGVQLNNSDFSSKDYGTTSAVSLNPLASINPADIESVTVLKDAAAGAIYGARAANGVVIIKTKRGRGGNTQFNLNYSVGVQEPTRKLKLLDGPQYRQLFREAYRNDSLAARRAGSAIPRFPTAINDVPVTRASVYGGSTNTDWYDEVFQRGRTQDVSLSASGGSDKTRFYVSGGYNDNNSMLKGNEFQRASLRVNIDNDATDRLTIGTQVGLYYTINNQVRTSYNGGLGAAQSTALPIFPVRNYDGSYFGTQLANPRTYFNPAAQLEDKFSTDVLRTLSVVYFNYKLAKGLELRPQVGLDYFDQTERFYFSPVNRYYRNKGLGALNERHVNFYNFTTNTTLTYNKDLDERNHLGAVVGTDVQYNVQRDLGFYTRDEAGFLDPYFTQVTANIATDPRYLTTLAQGSAIPAPLVGYNSRDFYRFASFFGRVNYAYAGKYIAEVSVRTDGSSRFGPNRRFGFFPAVSGAWIASDENFLKEQKYLSLLKFRASLGRTGNAELGGNFNYVALVGPSAGYLGVQGQSPTQLANPDLTWENNRSYDLAVDFGLFEGRLSGTAAYYNKRGSNILLNQAVQVSATGFDRLAANSGVVIQNQGWEFELTSRNLMGPKLTWSTSLNLSANYNKVLSAGGIPPDGFDSGGPGDARVIEGYPVGTNYLAEYAGVNPETGNPRIRALDGKLIDLTNTTNPTVITSNRVPSGHPFPKLQGGIDNTFTFAGFDLNVFFVGTYGNLIYDDGGKYQNGGRLGSWNQTTRLLDRWQQPGDQAAFGRLTLKPFNPDQNNTTQWLYDGSYLRLRNLSLGYALPKSVTSKMHISRLRVYVTGTNLFVLTKFPGWDPEVVRYADAGSQTGRNNGSNLAFTAPYLPTPQARTFTAGFTLGF